MTKGAYAFIAAGVAVYLVAGQTQVGWLYLFDAIIWSLLVLSAILPGYSLKSLKVEQQLLLPAMRARELPLDGPLEDEPVEIRLKVNNSGRFSRYFIRLEADYAFGQPESRRKIFLLNEIQHGATAAVSCTCTAYRRGHYPSSGVTLQSGGPLGLFVRRRSLSLPLNLTVYPAYYRMGTLPAAGEDGVERGFNVKSSAASDFYGSRDFRHGDQLKQVHWRNTARVGRFMVKEFEKPGQASLAVAFDTSRDLGTGRETTLEYSIKIAASLSKLCADSGRRLDIIAGGTVLHNADWQTSMDFLARLEVAANPASVDFTPISAGSRFTVVILPSTVTGQTAALLRLAGEGRGMAVLLEGFTLEDESEEVIALNGSGMEIISCRQGNLEATLDKVGNSLTTAGELSGGIN